MSKRSYIVYTHKPLHIHPRQSATPKERSTWKKEGVYRWMGGRDVKSWSHSRERDFTSPSSSSTHTGNACRLSLLPVCIWGPDIHSPVTLWPPLPLFSVCVLLPVRAWTYCTEQLLGPLCGRTTHGATVHGDHHARVAALGCAPAALDCVGNISAGLRSAGGTAP